MSIFRSAVLGAALAIALPVSARAANITAQNPQAIAAALQRAGYRAEVTKDNDGDPMIKSASGGTSFAVFFFNCKANKDCRTIQFFAGFSDAKISYEAMNKWNADKRFARGYIATSGAARVEMDVDLDFEDGGMPEALFVDNLEYWVLLLSEFEKFLEANKS